MGTIACRKKLFERVRAEIKISKDRLTNSYNCLAESKISLVNLVRRDGNYVVFSSLSRCKQPAISNSLKQGDPKDSKRRGLLEFGMPRSTIRRNPNVSGVRRTHNTKLIIGKGSSYTISLPEWVLSGSLESREVLLFKKMCLSKEKAKNLSLIMSNPMFLIGCWVRLKSKGESSGISFDKKGVVGEVKYKWFIETANSFRNGSYQFQPSRRVYIPKHNRNKKPLTIPSLKDKIVQEGMRFLMQLVFESTIKKTDFRWRTGNGFSNSLNLIKRNFSEVNWFIEGDVVQQLQSMNRQILTKALLDKIDDQPFIDLIHKYMKVGVTQEGLISPILINIYMNKLDKYIEGELILSFNKGENKKENPEYTCMIKKHGIAVGKTIRTTIGNDTNFKRMKYVRYGGNFLIGIHGSKNDCEYIRLKIKNFLKEKLDMTLNMDKTKITHAQNDSAIFLGYRIRIPKLKKHIIKRNKNLKLIKNISRPILDGSTDIIIKRLKENGFCKKGGIPTRNGKYYHLNLYDMVKMFRSIERDILNYYKIANNYNRIVARVHYILKYSCALTIALKMKLKTLRKVFSKYGKNLNVRSELGKATSYPAPKLLTSRESSSF